MKTKRFFLLVLFLTDMMLSINVMAQSPSDSALSQEIVMLYDSLKISWDKGEYQKAFSLCDNGIKLLDHNDRFYTPATCNLCLMAGMASLNMKDYYRAKAYLLKGFILDEMGVFGMGIHAKIANIAESQIPFRPFKELLDFVKSDTLYLNMLYTNPAMLGSKLNTAAWDQFNRGEFSAAYRLFDMETNLLDAFEKRGDDNYLSIIPCKIMCLRELHDYEQAKVEANYYLEQAKYYMGEHSSTYVDALNMIAIIEDVSGHSSEAIKHYQEALALIQCIL